MPASTTAKTYTKAVIDKATEKAKQRILEEMGASTFAAVTEMVCKLYAKYLKEELSK